MASKQLAPGNERNARNRGNHFYDFGPFRLDLANHLLFRLENEEEVVVHLTPKVFETLLALVQNAGQVLTKEELLDQLWPDTAVEEGNLTRNIATLRKALGEEHGEHHYIETIARRGYRFIAKVQCLTAQPPAPALKEYQPAAFSAPEPVGSEPGLLALEQAESRPVTREEIALLSILADVANQKILPATQDEPARAEETALATLPREFQTTPFRRFLKRHRQNIHLSAALLLAGVAVTLWLVEWRNGEPVTEPFQTMEITRLNTAGQVRDVVISPDGKYVAYVQGDAGRQSLRLRQALTNNEVEVVAPAETRYRGLTFAPDGNYLFFVSRQKNEAANVLYRLPLPGGTAKKLLSDVDSAPTFSPDGAQLAFVRESPTVGESVLLVANADGSGERRLAVRKLPAFISVDGPAWSPDGQQIACASASFQNGLAFQVVLVNVADGSETVLGAQRWLWMKRLVWLPDGSGLLLLARQQRTNLSNQIWQITYPQGETRRVTNDLSDYNGLSLTDNARTLVTVQVEQRSTLWVTRLPTLADPARAMQITATPSRQDGLRGLAWTPDGRIVYSSNEGNTRDLWIVNANGTQPERLTNNAGDNFSPTVSRKGQFIIFLSDRSNAVRVWRMALDGGQPQELTHGELDQTPTLSPDEQWVVYSSIQTGKRTLWKVPVSGGEAVPVTKHLTEYPSLSPDGQMIACLYREAANAPSSVAVLSWTDGTPLRFFDLPSIPWPFVRWLPTATEPTLTWVETNDEISNLWSQPYNGGSPTRLTNFQSERIFAYVWSPDGQQLALARGAVIRDVVRLDIANTK
ncbi:MAG TPA: winged helix-turn-helix domain-containing protein [Blastocatellia bacterium]|nr:winged helix-turn-helix domain-containing protein [Blastocatellia bacterium]